MLHLKVTLSNPTEQFAGIFALRCPHCGNNGTFQNIQKINDVYLSSSKTYIGIRKCPSPDCYGQVFFIRPGGNDMITYPAIRVDFDKSGIPTKILNTFEEAITCHANKCY